MFTARNGLNSFNMVLVNLGLYRLRRPVACLSPRRTGFDPRPVWDLWRTKWKWKRFFAQYFDFPPPVPLHQRSVLIFSLTLLVPKVQASKDWEPSNKDALFRKSGSTPHKRTKSQWIKLHTFLDSVLDGDEGLASRPDRFTCKTSLGQEYPWNPEAQNETVSVPARNQTQVPRSPNSLRSR